MHVFSIVVISLSNKVVSTTSNQAYGVVSNDQLDDHDYEMVEPLSVRLKRQKQKQSQNVKEPVYDVIA